MYTEILRKLHVHICLLSMLKNKQLIRGHQAYHCAETIVVNNKTNWNLPLLIVVNDKTNTSNRNLLSAETNEIYQQSCPAIYNLIQTL